MLPFVMLERFPIWLDRRALQSLDLSHFHIAMSLLRNIPRRNTNRRPPRCKMLERHGAIET
jgi:hypothetical protein